MTRQDLVKTLRAVAAATALIAAATLVCLGLDVDLTAAALVLIVAVLLATVSGRLPGAVIAAVEGFLCLNYFFTVPRHSFDVAKGDDLVALVAFAVAAGVMGATVTSLDRLRRTAEQRERETQIRLDLTSRLLAGEEPETIVKGAAEALVALFDLASCTVTAAGATTSIAVTAPGGPAVEVASGPLSVVATPGRRGIAGTDRTLLEALVAGLGTALDRLRLEAEARDARVAAQVGRTRAGFLSAVTHNLRTPLASIKAASSTLLSPSARLDDRDRRELLETVYEETDRLGHLVDNILELSRIRAGALETHRQRVDLADLAHAAIRRVRPIARAHRVRLDLPADVGDVDVDVEMMEQVFSSLLENALRYAPPGSEIRVSADRDGAGVTVRVADHGPGVPVAERERVFEEFVRVDARPDASGTGLGLAIARALVAAHGGTICCGETAGGGATFAFSIPGTPRR